MTTTASGLSRAIATEIADNWETMAAMEQGVSTDRRATLRECADLIRMMSEQRPQPGIPSPASDDGPIAGMPLNPWVPMSRPIDLKHIGKLQEELGEAAAAASRCVIQGIDESEPVTGKVNRTWLQEELADVLANIELNVEHFALDAAEIERRKERKKAHLRAWHGLLADG
jgi:hypothetical protein